MTSARARLVAIAVLGSGSVSACVHAPPPQYAELEVIAEPPTARVSIDGHYVGTAAMLQKHPKQLKPGTSFLTFEAIGYFPHDAAVKLVPGKSTVRIKLRPVPK